MDAQQFESNSRPKAKPKARQAPQTILVRLGLAWLAIVLAAGVWQGYGSLLSGGGGNVS